MAKVIAVLTLTPSTVTQRNMPAMIFLRSPNTPTDRRPPPRARLTSSLGSFSAASPANSVFASSWRRPATPWWSHRAKTARTRCSIRAARRRNRNLAAFLARLYDQGAHR